MRPVTLTQTRDGSGFRLRDTKLLSPLAALKRDRSSGARFLLEEAIAGCFPDWQMNQVQRTAIAQVCGDVQNFGPDDPGHLERIVELQATLQELLQHANQTPIIVIWEDHVPTFVTMGYNQIINGRYQESVFVLAWQGAGQVCFDSLSIDLKSFPGLTHDGLFQAIADMHEANPENPLLTYRAAQQGEISGMFTHGKKASFARQHGLPADGREATVSRQPLLASFEGGLTSGAPIDDIELRVGMPENSVRVLFRSASNSSGSSRASGVGDQGHAALILRDHERYYHVSLYHQTDEHDNRISKPGCLAWCYREKKPLLFESYHRPHRVEPRADEELVPLASLADQIADEFGGGRIFGGDFPEDKRYPSLVIEMALPSAVRKIALGKKLTAKEAELRALTADDDRRGCCCSSKREKVNLKLAAIRAELATIDQEIAGEMAAMVTYYKNFLAYSPGWVFCAPVANLFRLNWIRDSSLPEYFIFRDKCPDFAGRLLKMCWPNQQNCATLARNILAAGGISDNPLYASGIYANHAWAWLGKEVLFQAVLLGIGFGLVVGIDQGVGQDQLNAGEEVGVAAALIFLRLFVLRLLSSLRDAWNCCYSEVSFDGLQQSLLAMAKDRSGRAKVVATRDTLNSTVVITEGLAPVDLQVPVVAPPPPQADLPPPQADPPPGVGYGTTTDARGLSPATMRRNASASSADPLLGDGGEPLPSMAVGPFTLAGAGARQDGQHRGGLGARAPAALHG